MSNYLVSYEVNRVKKYTELNNQHYQRIIYTFFIDIVNQWESNQVIEEFEQTFCCLSSHTNSNNIQALNWMIVEKNEALFRETIKRCFYILINNWNINRNYNANQCLIQTVEKSSQTTKYSYHLSSNIKCLRKWLHNFIQSQDYQKIQQFALSHTQSWTHRYESYLLTPSAVDPDISQVQRKAALQLAQEIKEKYKFDLAMYVTRSDCPTSLSESQENPTQLGKEVVTLIKKTLSTQNMISYDNQAKLFIEQSKNLNSSNFKIALLNYLGLSSKQQYPIPYIRDKFCQKLDKFELTFAQASVSKRLISKICQQLIQTLTTENSQSPSSCFCLLTSQEKYLTLVLLLLKLVLISRSSQNYLDQKIANLIHHYQSLEEKQCQKFIQFLEIFNLVFTLFTTNLQFHLVKIQPQSSLPKQNLDQYRLFCQLKGPDLRQINLKAATFNNQDLRGADLRKIDLQKRELIQVDLRLANLSQANLSQSVLNGSQLLIANLTQADLSQASLIKANLHRANLQQANLTKASLTSANLNFTNLSQANLNQANLMAAHLQEADLRNANLECANLECADLTQVDLTGANLSYACLKGANLQRAKLEGANLYGADLTGVNLSHTHLYQANLSLSKLYRANLNFADLTEANLTRVNLNQANLYQVKGLAANFKSASLRRANIVKAYFNNAEFSFCDLTRANFKQTDLNGANLSNTCIRHTILNCTNLSNTNLQGANLFGSNLQQAILHNTKFGQNSGLSEHLKHHLKNELNQ
ncbi:MAG: pentapeptide repeat-containing protein [Microcoleaceae cyanobacterium]